MKRINSISTVLISIIVVWFMFLIIPFIVRLFYHNLSIMELLGISFSAATALFTGVAFAVAFRSLSNQQENLREQQENLKIQQDSLSKQIDLNVFSVFMDSLKIVTNSKSFRSCQDYILSDKYYDDLDFIRQYLHKNKGAEITLDDYSKVLDQNEADILKDNEREQLKELRYGRDKIKTFCMRMEFVGIIVSNLKDKTAEKLLLDLYGHTIKKTYKRLGPLIEKCHTEGPYEHYSQLFNLAKV